MRNTAPDGYLICNGGIYNIGDYPLLEELFTNEFGAVNYFGGDGTTTFAVPDLRGEFLRGTGTNGHSEQGSGANVGIHQDGTKIPYIDMHSEGTTRFISGDCYTDFQQPKNADYITNSPPHTWAVLPNENINQSNYALDYTARPTSTSVLYCIRAY